MELLTCLDILGSLLILISVWNLQKAKYWWLVYVPGCLVFAWIFVLTRCPASIILELILAAVGIKNYREFGKGGKNE